MENGSIIYIKDCLSDGAAITKYVEIRIVFLNTKLVLYIDNKSHFFNHSFSSSDCYFQGADFSLSLWVIVPALMVMRHRHVGTLRPSIRSGSLVCEVSACRPVRERLRWGRVSVRGSGLRRRSRWVTCLTRPDTITTASTWGT